MELGNGFAGGHAPWVMAAAFAVFFLAGLVKGVVGLGLPTLSMALLALLVAPPLAAAWLVVPSLVTNIWQLRPWPSLPSMTGRLAGLLLGVCGGTLLAALLLGAPSGSWATAALGWVLLAYALWSLSGAQARIPASVHRWLGPLVGLLTGAISAATGVFVVPAVPYLQALGLQRDALIQAMGLSFTVSTLALAVALVLNDSYPLRAAGESLLLLAPALLGMWAGQHLRQAMSPTLFRRCFLLGLALLGLHMAWRPWLN
ncbi:sulfite exporter TauE/SafE family protein [Acidovorax sp. Be4]|uniref:Probable membrane transporter protein n=1 Tax=Acidovorax bellezanensis TaxID=2976702 RepID=A0ABT2PKQ7_9BURK|nr:sulfite exporter TauE/SafE family protein [Acidovorax sp. Be4]MCT9811061.1 sulfite exporter TauE/SafE family protein [Acidovorax sp. Be4]